MAKDVIHRVLEQWRAARPELDFEAMGVIGRLARVAQLGRSRIEERLADFDLTIGDFDVLASLRRAGPPFTLTPTQLYSALLLSSGTMTHRIDRLAERGLVERLPDPSDRRGVRVRLTDEGRARVDLAVEAHLVRERDVLAALSTDERRALDRLLGKLLRGLEESG